MLSDTEIIAVATSPITLEFVVRMLYTVDELADVVTVVINDTVSVIDVDVLTEFDIAVTISSERVSLEDSLSFCFC